jgi:hypothetical protein
MEKNYTYIRESYTDWSDDQLNAATTLLGIFIEMDLEQRARGLQTALEGVDKP